MRGKRERKGEREGERVSFALHLARENIPGKGDNPEKYNWATMCIRVAHVNMRGLL